MKTQWICYLFNNVPRFHFLYNLESYYPIMRHLSFCGTSGLITHVQSAVQWEKLLVFSVFYCKMLLVYFKNNNFLDVKYLSSSFTVLSFIKSS